MAPRQQGHAKKDAENQPEHVAINTKWYMYSFRSDFQSVTFRYINEISGMIDLDRNFFRTWIVRWLAFIALTVLAETAFAQLPAASCVVLKEGKFQADNFEGPGVWDITRKAGVQKEVNEAIGVAVEYLIEWIDDCTFRLLPLNVIRNDARLELGGDTKFIVEIVDVSDSTYIQETTVWKTGQYIDVEVKIVR